MLSRAQSERARTSSISGRADETVAQPASIQSKAIIHVHNVVAGSLSSHDICICIFSL